MNRRTLLKGSGALALMSTSAIVLTGCPDASGWLNTAINDLPVAESIAQSIASIVTLASGNGALEPAVAIAIDLAVKAVTAGLQTVQTLLTGYKASKDASVVDQIDAALSDVQANLSAILQAAHVKSAALQTSIAAGVGLLVAAISSIQTLIPPAAKASSLRKAGPHLLKSATVMPNAEQLTSGFNAVLVLNGLPQYQVVR